MKQKDDFSWLCYLRHSSLEHCEFSPCDIYIYKSIELFELIYLHALRLNDFIQGNIVEITLFLS